jgi:hypothetical protein
MSFALSEAHGFTVAIDDLRAIRRAKRVYSPFVTIGTVELLMLWQEKNLVPSSQLSEMIAAVERLARYRPGKNHPHVNWWNDPK